MKGLRDLLGILGSVCNTPLYVFPISWLTVTKDCRISAFPVKGWSDTWSALQKRELAGIGPEVVLISVSIKNLHDEVKCSD